jgi:hypothetical protein
MDMVAVILSIIAIHPEFRADADSLYGTFHQT